jgi:hypothetical protein
MPVDPSGGTADLSDRAQSVSEPSGSRSGTFALRGRRFAPRGGRGDFSSSPPAPRGQRLPSRGERFAPRGERLAPWGGQGSFRRSPPAPRGEPSAPQGKPSTLRGEPSARQGEPSAPQGESSAPRGEALAGSGLHLAPVYGSAGNDGAGSRREDGRLGSGGRRDAGAPRGVAPCQETAGNHPLEWRQHRLCS